MGLRKTKRMRGGGNFVLDEKTYNWKEFKPIIKPGDIFYWKYDGSKEPRHIRDIRRALFGVYATATYIGGDKINIKFLVNDTGEAIILEKGIDNINTMPSIKYDKDNTVVSEERLNDNSTFQKVYKKETVSSPSLGVETNYSPSISEINALTLRAKQKEIREEQEKEAKRNRAIQIRKILERAKTAFIHDAESKGYTLHTESELREDATKGTEIETLEGFLRPPLSGESRIWKDYTVVKGKLTGSEYPEFMVDKRPFTQLQELYYKKVLKEAPKEAPKEESSNKGNKGNKGNNEITPAESTSFIPASLNPLKGGKRTHKKRKSKRKTHRKRR